MELEEVGTKCRKRECHLFHLFLVFRLNGLVVGMVMVGIWRLRGVEMLSLFRRCRRDLNRREEHVVKVSHH